MVDEERPKFVRDGQYDMPVVAVEGMAPNTEGTAGRAVQAEGRATGYDTEGGRRRKTVGNTDGRRQVNPAGDTPDHKSDIRETGLSAR